MHRPGRGWIQVEVLLRVVLSRFAREPLILVMRIRGFVVHSLRCAYFATPGLRSPPEYVYESMVTVSESIGNRLATRAVTAVVQAALSGDVSQYTTPPDSRTRHH